MSEPLQEPDRTHARAIASVALATVALIAGVVGISWCAIASPPRPTQTPPPSTLEHGLFATSPEPPADRATPPDRYQWIDRGARVARIPIDSAIDAVVADPSLIAGGRR